MPFSTNTDIWFAGAFAAFTVDFLVYPLDTLKTRLQSPNYARLYKNTTTGAVNRGLLFRGLYQGIGSVVVATVPSSGAFFTTYEFFKHALTVSASDPSSSYLQHLPTPITHAIASSIAESVSCLILTPAEVLKQNAQVIVASSSTISSPYNTNSHQQDIKTATAKSRPFSSVTLTVLREFRSHPTRLWRGYTALVARNLPFTGLQFPMFERLKTVLLDWRETRRIKLKQNDGSSDNEIGIGIGIAERAIITGASAGTAGSVAALITTPIDVVKTRIMLKALEGGKAREMTATKAAKEQQQRQQQQQQQKPTAQQQKQHHQGLEGMVRAREIAKEKKDLSGWRVGRDVWVSEGVKGLFKGGALRAVWTAVGSGLYLGTYEAGRHWLERRRGERGDEEVI